MSAATDVLIEEIASIYSQLDPARRSALADHAKTLRTEQDAMATVRARGALSADRLVRMSLGEVMRHAEEIEVPVWAVIRVAEEEEEETG